MKVLWTRAYSQECECGIMSMASSTVNTIKNRILNGERMCGENKNGCWWMRTNEKEDFDEDDKIK